MRIIILQQSGSKEGTLIMRKRQDYYTKLNMIAVSLRVKQVDTQTNCIENIMCEIDQNVEVWLEEKLIPVLKACLNKTKCKVQYVISLPTDSVFMARIYLLDLKFFSTEGKIEDQVNLVVKRPPLGNKGRILFDLDAAFHNEILFYTTLAKFYNNLQSSTVYPKPYYTLEKPPYDSIIVTENINYQGYYLNSEKANLDIKYIVASMREIAKFHANAYIMKDRKPEEFFEIVKNIQKCRNPPTEDSASVRNTKALVPRIINYLRKHNHDETFCKKLEKFLINGFAYATLELSKPIEPLATICHGDFIRNNVFFKKSNDSIQTKLIDFGLLNYGSPCQDIAHFLYLSGSRSHRTDEFHEIFDEYYKTLLKNLQEAGLENLDRFSKGAFLENYRINSFFGYSIAAIFLCVMLGYFGDNPERLLFLPLDELCQMFAEVGGDEYTEILVQMILDLRKAGSLDCINDISIE